MKLLSVLMVFALCGYCVGVPAAETGGMSCIRRKLIGCCVILLYCHVLQAGLRTATPMIFLLQAAHRDRLCKKAVLHSLAMYG